MRLDHLVSRETGDGGGLLGQVAAAALASQRKRANATMTARWRAERRRRGAIQREMPLPPGRWRDGVPAASMLRVVDGASRLTCPPFRVIITGAAAIVRDEADRHAKRTCAQYLGTIHRRSAAQP
eukprot:SAG31_NODE_5155_length_2711_cov_2.412711_1_plen_125_part_00